MTLYPKIEYKKKKEREKVGGKKNPLPVECEDQVFCRKRSLSSQQKKHGLSQLTPLGPETLWHVILIVLEKWNEVLKTEVS